MKFKSFIIVMMSFVCPLMYGQTNDSLLDKISSGDTTAVADVVNYVESCRDVTKDHDGQVYDMILAVDNVMANCSDYLMYKTVFHNLIHHFKGQNCNQVVDFLVSLPYFEFIEVNRMQYEEMTALAESFSRVKIGSVAPSFHSVTASGDEFDLGCIHDEFTAIMFWSADCPHCRDLMKQLGSYLETKDNVAFVTICVVGDEKKANKIARKYNKDGIIINAAKGWKSKVVDDYAVDVTPSVFILNKEKVIIAKPFDIKEFMETIR